MTIAAPTDVTSRWIGSAPIPEDAVIKTYLEDVEVMIRHAFPALTSRLAEEDGLTDRVKLVEVRAVIRALKNPDQIRQTAITTGPFTESETMGTETLSGLALTDVDLAFLAPAGAGAKQQAFSIDLTPRSARPALEHALVNGPAWMAPAPGPAS